MVVVNLATAVSFRTAKTAALPQAPLRLLRSATPSMNLANAGSAASVGFCTASQIPLPLRRTSLFHFRRAGPATPSARAVVVMAAVASFHTAGRAPASQRPPTGPTEERGVSKHPGPLP